MTKAELIERIRRSRGKGLTKKKIAEIVDGIFHELGNYLVKQRITKKNGAPKFTYPGFGTFTKKKRKAPVGRNPKTGELMEIPASVTVSFATGKDLRRRLNR